MSTDLQSAVDRLNEWLRATWDGSCRICGMGSTDIDQHAGDCNCLPLRALAARSTPLPTETCDPNVNPWDCTVCEHAEDHPPAPLPTERPDLTPTDPEIAAEG